MLNQPRSLFKFAVVFLLSMAVATSALADCETAMAQLDKVSRGERIYKEEAPRYSLDANTRNDLRVLDRLYPQLNKTRTYFGAQRLSWLLQNPYLDVAEIKERQVAVQDILETEGAREALGKSLSRLSRAADGDFATYFQNLKKPFSPGRNISVIQAILSALAGYSIYNPHARGMLGLIILPILSIHSNMMQAIHRTREDLQDFKTILREGSILAKTLTSAKSPALVEIRKVLEAIENSSHPNSPKLTVASLKRMIGPNNPFGYLVDIVYGQGDQTLPTSIKRIINEKEKLAIILSAIGELDTYVALADYTQEHRDTVIFPEILDSETNQFFLTLAHNPYLFNKSEGKSVPNSLAMHGGNEQELANFVILTGPNAGGKSTFLKTIALSSISAQIGAPVPAKVYIFTPTEIMTNIDLSDSLEEGKSFYRAEGARLAQVAKRAKQPEKLMIIMDEILLGTNPEDRHVLEKQVIRFFEKSAHLTLLATHDIQVTKLAKEMPGIMNLKVDEVRDEATGDFHFSFNMVPGVSETSTAYEVLRAEGVPAEIIDAAYLERFGSQKTPKF